MVSLIGLSGYARSGKDSLADFLVEDHGFVRVSFAQPMRDALYALNPRVNFTEYDELQRLQDVIDVHGWDGYKDSDYGDEIRELMQRFGTEVARKQWDENFWVSIAIDKALDLLDDGKKVVFTDCRFPNEAERVQYYGGEVWRVRRPGVFPANGHASESALDEFGFDKFIDNNGSLDDLSWVVAHHVA